MFPFDFGSNERNKISNVAGVSSVVFNSVFSPLKSFDLPAALGPINKPPFFFILPLFHF